MPNKAGLRSVAFANKLFLGASGLIYGYTGEFWHDFY